MTLYWRRCACGLRVATHFQGERVLSCDEAEKARRWSKIKFKPLRELMLRSLQKGQ